MIVCQFIKITAFFLCGVMFMALMFEVWKQVRTITNSRQKKNITIHQKRFLNYCNYFVTYSAINQSFHLVFSEAGIKKRLKCKEI